MGIGPRYHHHQQQQQQQEAQFEPHCDLHGLDDLLVGLDDGLLVDLDDGLLVDLDDDLLVGLDVVHRHCPADQDFSTEKNVFAHR